MRFGEELLKRRKALGLTQRAVAEAAGIAPAHVGHIEAGRIAVPRADVAKRIATAVRVSLDEMLAAAEKRGRKTAA